MKRQSKFITLVLLFSFSMISCASQKMVSEKSIEYLNKKYNHKFRVVSVDMNHDEGNWGSADLIISPENDSSLTFSVIYDYSDEKLTWEDYKGALWNREIGSEALSSIQSGKVKARVKARITSKESITLDSMNLPYKKNYNEILPVIEKPAVTFDIDLISKEECSGRLWPYENLIVAAENFRGKGFRKVMFSVNLFCGEKQDKACQVLKFKLTRDLPVPEVNLIKKLVIKSGESPVDARISSLYSEALKSQKEGDTDRALSLYMEVVRINDNPYRYDPYAPIESGFVIESAFYAAGIEREKGETARAEKLYSFVVERIRYMEVKGDFYWMEKEAMKYLEKN